MLKLSQILQDCKKTNSLFHVKVSKIYSYAFVSAVSLSLSSAVSAAPEISAQSNLANKVVPSSNVIIPSINNSGAQDSQTTDLAAAVDKASSTSESPEFSGSSNSSDTKIASAVGGFNSIPRDNESELISQAVQGSAERDQIDIAPVKLPERQAPLTNFTEFKTGLLYKLPAKMFLQGNVENSLRLETNVLQQARNQRADMIYRILPNVTVGYALTKTTRVSGNYFFLRDQYTRDKQLLSRNFHSFGLQINQDIPINDKTTLTLGFMGRQLLLSRTQPLSDLLPSVQIVRRVGNNAIVYGGVLGQIRFRNTLGKFQEGDQFYSLGGIYRLSRWQFSWDNTWVSNFGVRKLRGGPNNQVMIMTLEADYKVHPKLPVVAFFRAQPIFNIGANQALGFAGVNVRIFGGLRMDFSKPAIFPVKIPKNRA